ncbi:hypothetical protein ACQ1Z8_18145, partial [Enterococcus faecalis]
QKLQNKNYHRAKLCFKDIIKEYEFSEAYTCLAATIGSEAESKSLMEKITLYPSLKKYTELAVKKIHMIHLLIIYWLCYYTKL